MRISNFIQGFGGRQPAVHLDGAQQHRASTDVLPKTRRRLFTKYVALFVAVVGVPLLSNGIFDVFFYYQEHKASLIRIQREQAEAAAAKIGQFIKEIESQLGWTTQLPWSAGSIEQRRFDALRLLRQVPAITELAQVDSTGKERLRVSRLAMDVVDSGLDFSKDPKFTEAVARKVYYGPVYFRRESEPYMTLSLAGTRMRLSPFLFHGFSTPPKWLVMLDEPMANSSRLVLPTMTAPAFHKLAVTVLSYGGTKPSRMWEPAVVCTPSV